MEEKIKKGDTKVKCRYCKNSIYKSKSFTNPDKPRMYYCNEECFNNAIKELSVKKTNSNNADKTTTCRCCGKKIQKDKAFMTKQGYYYCSENEYNNKYVGSEAYFEETFLDYIYFDMSNKQCDFPLLQRQAPLIHDKFGYKWTGMIMTLKFFHETLKLDWNNEWGLGQIFPKYYIQARDFWNQQRKIKEITDEIEEDETIFIERKKKETNIPKWEEL